MYECMNKQIDTAVNIQLSLFPLCFKYDMSPQDGPRMKFWHSWCWLGICPLKRHGYWMSYVLTKRTVTCAKSFDVGSAISTPCVSTSVCCFEPLCSHGLIGWALGTLTHWRVQWPDVSTSDCSVAVWDKADVTNTRIYSGCAYRWLQRW